MHLFLAHISQLSCVTLATAITFVLCLAVVVWLWVRNRRELIRHRSALQREQRLNEEVLCIDRCVSDIARRSVPREDFDEVKFMEYVFGVLSAPDRIGVFALNRHVGEDNVPDAEFVRPGFKPVVRPDPAARERFWQVVRAEVEAEGVSVVGDVAERFPELAPNARKSSIKSVVVLPRTANEKRIGYLVLCFNREHVPSKRIKTMYKVLGETISATRERVVAYRELMAQRDLSLAAVKARSYFFSTVSHDIRTPLNAIVGFAEMLKLGIDDEAERKAALDAMLVSSRTLLQLINDVLDLSKLEVGRMTIVPEPTNVADLFNGVLSAFRVALKGKDVALEMDVKPMPLLKIDPQRIRQILFNLVGNAVKFTERGSIDIAADWSGGAFSFSVRDTGCGMTKTELERVANAYEQTGEGRRAGGTGLGVTICKQLVECMHGTLEIESVKGQGSFFEVIIPNVESEAQDLKRHLSTTQKIKLSVSRPLAGYRRVLVADDSPVNLRVIRAMLERFGITDITTVPNGRLALDMLVDSSATFDLVLTDMWMPEMDGESLVRAIRAVPALATLPVYALTADVEAPNNCADAGFTGVLLKPLTLEKLAEALGEQ